MTGYPNLAIGGGFDACKQFSEGRLSGSIGATDGEDLTCISLEVDPVERLHAGVVLLDANRLEGQLTRWELVGLFFNPLRCRHSDSPSCAGRLCDRDHTYDDRPRRDVRASACKRPLELGENS